MQVWHPANTILKSEALRRKETDQLTQKLSLNINGVIPVPSTEACCHDQPPVHDFHPPEQRKSRGWRWPSSVWLLQQHEEESGCHDVTEHVFSSGHMWDSQPVFHSEGLQLLSSFLNLRVCFFCGCESLLQVRHSATSVQLFLHHILF